LHPESFRSAVPLTDDASPAVELRVAGAVASLALNRPRVHNAVNDRLREELVAAIEEVARDDRIRGLVVTGNGASFCAGGDIGGMEERLRAPTGEVALNGWRRQQRTHRAVASLHALAKPTVAAVNGAASGLGCDLALCCDFIVASSAASFSMSYVRRGQVPDGGGLYFLPRRVGLARAKQLIFTGRRVEAEEALAIGIADRIVAPESLLTEAIEFAEQVSREAPAALALSKSILNQTFELTLEQAFALGSQAQAICYTTAEHRAAVAQFLQRPPRSK
jgi:enoyl-CoA hydratase/carnithine racemase